MVRDVESGGRVNRSGFVVRVAERAGIDVKLATAVYEAMVEEIISIASQGDRLTLTGFGKFYPQKHKGHKVQKVNEGGKLQGTGDGEAEVVADYAVLKFSATRAVNRRIDPELAGTGGSGADSDDD